MNTCPGDCQVQLDGVSREGIVIFCVLIFGVDQNVVCPPRARGNSFWPGGLKKALVVFSFLVLQNRKWGLWWTSKVSKGTNPCVIM